MRRLMRLEPLPLAIIGALGLSAGRACAAEAAFAPIGDAKAGAALILPLGCGRCHTVPGVEGADGDVGPSLNGIGNRKILAGFVANTPENMQAWLKTPQTLVPGNAMPDMGIDDAQARDLTAFLYTLR